jgi:hypothetical protein
MLFYQQSFLAIDKFLVNFENFSSRKIFIDLGNSFYTMHEYYDLMILVLLTFNFYTLILVIIYCTIFEEIYFFDQDIEYIFSESEKDIYNCKHIKIHYRTSIITIFSLHNFIF